MKFETIRHAASGDPGSATNRSWQFNDAMSQQRSFWNGWNGDVWKSGRGEISRRQSEVVLNWLGQSRRRDLKILEVGCGTGWFCPKLAEFGDVTGTDLSDEVLNLAQSRWPKIRFIAGDFLTLPFAEKSFDVVVSLEVLSHVADQSAFIERIAWLLKPGGMLLLATQNRPVLQNYCNVPVQMPGQLRRWVDRKELSSIVAPYLDIEGLFSVTPIAHRGTRRLLTSSKVNAVLGLVFGNHVRTLMEARDWGWTLMLKSRKQTDRDEALLAD